MHVPLSRRAALGLGAGAALMAAGCASSAGPGANTAPTIPAATGKVTLTYWSWLKDLQVVADGEYGISQAMGPSDDTRAFSLVSPRGSAL